MNMILDSNIFALGIETFTNQANKKSSLQNIYVKKIIL